MALIVAGVIAVICGVPVDEAVILLGITLVASAGAGVIGATVLRRSRGHPVRAQALIVALSSVLVTVAGVVAAAFAMFISTHDLVALTIVLVVAAAVAVGAAFQMGDDIGVGTRQVGAYARTMVGGDGVITGVPEVTGPGELGSLATELAEVYRQLDESRKRERALEGSHRELIAWVSHDLRAPLATIRAMAEALDDDVADDATTISRYHRQIRSDAERLTGLVEDLFELSRINSGALRLAKERVWLGDVVADAMANAYAAAEVKGVQITERIGRLPAVEVSAREFCRALDNLLDNAIRHTPAGGTVAVETEIHEGAVSLSVVDECGGIPEADLPRVFDIAFRGDDSRIRDERGGGLGLAIAQGLIEAHSGSVSVTNHHHGCRFTVHLRDDVSKMTDFERGPLR
ncbi:sensor histidine kinase [Phytoactinopolyspora mesophila]|uniref:sensor histidine kinase n=1 Tax=Phytoactinopolyspora mesophila TaxID=2650750 RepID=UPI001C9E5834